MDLMSAVDLFFTALPFVVLCLLVGGIGFITYKRIMRTEVEDLPEGLSKWQTFKLKADALKKEPRTEPNGSASFLFEDTDTDPFTDISDPMYHHIHNDD